MQILFIFFHPCQLLANTHSDINIHKGIIDEEPCTLLIDFTGNKYICPEKSNAYLNTPHALKVN